MVFAGTFVTGAVVAMALGEAQRGTPLWRISLTLAVAIICILLFFVSAHLAKANRFVHVWIAAVLVSLPNLLFFGTTSDMTLGAFLTTIALMLVYASIGAGLSYALSRTKTNTDVSVV